MTTHCSTQRDTGLARSSIGVAGDLDQVAIIEGEDHPRRWVDSVDLVDQSSSRPIAVNTGEVTCWPLWQADPVEAATPGATISNFDNSQRFQRAERPAYSGSAPAQMG